MLKLQAYIFIFYMFQIPGRMGLLITLYLITFNLYGSISSTLAPRKRGFSYIEVWMVGVIITISVAILEYFVILAFKRRNKNANLDYIIEMIDFISLIINLACFSSFVIFYWMKGFGIFWIKKISFFLLFWGAKHSTLLSIFICTMRIIIIIKIYIA